MSWLCRGRGEDLIFLRSDVQPRFSRMVRTDFSRLRVQKWTPGTRVEAMSFPTNSVASFAPYCLTAASSDCDDQQESKRRIWRTFIGSRSRRMESGTGHLVRLTRRRNDAKFWIGMTPGMIGTLMPVLVRSVSWSPLTFPATCPNPFSESVHIVEQLSQDEIRSSITLDLQPM